MQKQNRESIIFSGIEVAFDREGTHYAYSTRRF